MKKKVFGIALVALSFVTLTSAAQTTDKSVCVKKSSTEYCGKDRPDCDRYRGKKADRKAFDPFEGIELTENQKSRLAQLKEKQRETRKAQMAKRVADRKADKDARIAARKAARQQYLLEVKEIIGSEKYVKFLENQIINQAPGMKKLRSCAKNVKRHHKGFRCHGHGILAPQSDPKAKS